MSGSIGDRLERDGVVIASTNGGGKLPVLDITHPRFAVSEDPSNMQALMADLIAAERRYHRLPAFLMRWLLKSAAKKSLLVRAMFAGDSAFLDGVSTYVMKLGPDNLLPPYDTPMDRKFAAAPHLVLLRLRTQQLATLVADGAEPALASRPSDALHMINIAGGTAMDSINALILLARRSAALLSRSIVIHILDPDEAGPSFCASAVNALIAPGNPLGGLDITVRHTRYDWNDTAPLAGLIDALQRDDAIIIASSEGGLFEYGGDDAIVSNLAALRGNTPKPVFVAGSVTRAEASRQKLIGGSEFQIIPRGLDGFAPLAASAGYAVVAVKSMALSDQVGLRDV